MGKINKDLIVYKPRSLGPSTTINNPNYIMGVDFAGDTPDKSEIHVYRVHDNKLLEVIKNGKEDGK